MLGCVLRDPEAARDVASELEVGDFYLPAHRHIYRAIVSLMSGDSIVSPEAVAERLRAWGILQQTGGQAKLDGLAQAAGGTTLNGHVKMVRNKARVRRLLKRLRDAEQKAIDADATDPDSIDRAVAGAKDALHELAPGASYETRTLGDVRDAVLERWDERARGESMAIPTGFRAIDRKDVAGGLPKEEYVILMGITGCGKTAAMLQMAYTQATVGHHVLIVSLEMPAESLMDRLVAHHAWDSYGGLDAPRVTDIRHGRNLSASQWGTLQEAAEDISGLPIYIHDDPNQTVEQIASRVRRHEKTHGRRLDVLYIDFLQRIAPSTDERYSKELGRIAYRLADLAKELEIPVVTLAQVLEKEVEKRGGWLRKTDLKDSGDPLQASGLVLGMRVPFEKRERVGINNFGEEVTEHYWQKVEGMAAIQVLKNRHGSEGKPASNLKFHGGHMVFVEEGGY